MSHLRILRLEADLADLRGWIDRGGSRYVDVLETRGMPPSTYRLALDVPGVEDVARDWLTPAGRRHVGPFMIRDRHEVELEMPEDYPYRPPIVRFLEPLLHPNVFPNGRLCWGVADSDPRWWRGGEDLGSLIERVLQVVVGTPSCTNPRSPANVHAIHPYTRHADLFPLAEIVTAPRAAPGGTIRFREAST